MSGTTGGEVLELGVVQRRLCELEGRADALEQRQVLLESGRARLLPVTSAPVRPGPRLRSPQPMIEGLTHGGRAAHERGPDVERPAAAEAHPPSPRVSPPAASAGLRSDLLGGRILAWVGGAAVLMGVLFFLALAASHGWIGREARTAIAGLASLGLLAAGVWLHERRGRTDAALAAAGTAVAALFCTLVVAARVYELIPGVLGVALAIGVGAVAATLAVRWRRQPLGAVGIVGALLSPVLVGAAPGLASEGILWVASAAAVGVLLWQRWDWLALAVFVCGVPQWGAWLLLESPGPAAELITPSAFGLLGLGAAIGYDLRARLPWPRPATVALFVLNTLVVATVGFFVLRQGFGRDAGELWLAGLALVHLAVGLAQPRVRRLSRPLGQLALVWGVILADLAFGLSAPGVVLGGGWAIVSVLFAGLRRRSAVSGDRRILEVGLGAHLVLVLVHALAAAPPTSLGHEHTLTAILAVCALATAAFTCARVLPLPSTAWRTALDALALATVAYLSALTLSGPALALAFTGEALALAQLARRTPGQFTLVAAGCFLLGGCLLALTGVAPPSALVYGAADLAGAALVLSALAVACASLARSAGAAPALSFGVASYVPGRVRVRSGLMGAAAATMLMLASIALVTVFQPAPGQVVATVLDLGVRQQGQVLLSALWSIVGLGGLLIGLRMRLGALRSAALALLLLTAGKVFLYDLATLDSIYRVISFVVLGLLLLAGAYAWQRMRPPRASGERAPRAGSVA